MALLIVLGIIFGGITFFATCLYTCDCIHYRMQTGRDHGRLAFGYATAAFFGCLDTGFIIDGNHACWTVVIGIICGVILYHSTK
jgi:hypothetical protein